MYHFVVTGSISAVGFTIYICLAAVFPKLLAVSTMASPCIMTKHSYIYNVQHKKKKCALQKNRLLRRQ